MRLQTLFGLLPLLSLSGASTVLQKRCSPLYDPDVPGGYYPPATCWQDFDPSCRAFIRQGTEMYVDAKHSLAIIFGVSESCFGTIAEDQRRVAAGLKNFGWEAKNGKLTRIGKDILVVSEMSERAVQEYQKMTYKGQ